MRDIPGYENLYGITEQGEIFNFKRNRYLKPYIDKSTGYY